MDDGQLLISMQASGTKPKVEIKEEEEEKEVKPDATKAGYRKKITAEELAQEFQKGHGKEFIGKFLPPQKSYSRHIICFDVTGP
jgi:hypothetical protein